MNTELIALRARITEADINIIESLEERMLIAEEVAEFKKENNLPIEDIKREEQVIEERKLHTALNEEFVEELFKLIFKESKRIQRQHDN